MNKQQNQDLLNLIDILSTDIMLSLDENDIAEILKIEDEIIEKFSKVLTINTENVEPMYYPLEQINTFLREDAEFSSISKEIVLKNAPLHDDNYIVIERVVNDES